ncbi:MAG: peptidoglycan editing factor PgeF [Gammaproteobacteria bacterium]|nr:peptidoglycan editing factor PgeF [Gammaproteobacteria bacterium]
MLIPEWPAPQGVRAVCSLREGGVSEGRYASLNLGDHVGDDPDQVEVNRSIFGRAVGGRPVYLTQVHGTSVCELDRDAHDGIEADACATVERGIACTIMVADCLPVLFADEAGRRVAAAHAGWRGLAAGVLERTLDSFGHRRVIAWLGPCIGPEAFEVGDEVRLAFGADAPSGAAGCFRPARAEGKWLADLAGLARDRLRAAGVDRLHGNDSSGAWCTVGNPLVFFSHRRDGVSGRFAASIWRE